MLTRDKTALTFSLLMMATPLMAQNEVEAGIGGDEWDGAPLVSVHARTIFPLYMGAGVELHASQNFSLGLDLGMTPKAYADAVGNLASRVVGKEDYKDTIATAFHDTTLYRINLHYNFRDDNKGWGIEAGLSQMSAKGDEKIADLAKVVNTGGQDFTNAAATAEALGYRPYVTMKTKMVAVDLMGTYRWELRNKFSATLGAGLIKVTNAQVEMSTGVPQFDSSKYGSLLLSMAESDVGSSIEKYGLAPILSFELAYVF